MRYLCHGNCEQNSYARNTLGPPGLHPPDQGVTHGRDMSDTGDGGSSGNLRPTLSALIRRRPRRAAGGQVHPAPPSDGRLFWLNDRAVMCGLGRCDWTGRGARREALLLEHRRKCH